MNFKNALLKKYSMKKFKENLSLLSGFVKKKPMKYWGLWTSGFFVGLMLQLGWIHEHCKDQPFLDPKSVICQDNLVRVTLGGPLFLLIFSLLYFFMIPIAFEFIKENKTKKKEKLSISVSNVLGIGSLILLWPFLNYSVYYALIVFLSMAYFILAVVYQAIEKTADVKIDYVLDRFDVLSITLLGNLTSENKTYLYEKMVEIIDILPDVKRVDFDIKAIKKLDTIGQYFLSILETSSQMLSIKFSKPKVSKKSSLSKTLKKFVKK